MESVRIAIVEDDKDASELLGKYVNDYGAEKNENIEVSKFYTVTNFLEACRGNFDIIFMDIELPDGNGMEAIARVREQDKDVIVIFVTNMAQFAVKGYEVRAFDFIIKPISYFNFCVKFSAALDCFRRRADVSVWIANKEGKIRLNASRIKYIEVFKHVLIYHTTDGDYTSSSGSLTALEEQLKSVYFASCNRCYLVNLRFVSAIRGMSVVVDGDELQVSHLKRASFLRELNAFLSGTVGGG